MQCWIMTMLEPTQSMTLEGSLEMEEALESMTFEGTK